MGCPKAMPGLVLRVCTCISGSTRRAGRLQLRFDQCGDGSHSLEVLDQNFVRIDHDPELLLEKRDQHEDAKRIDNVFSQKVRLVGERKVWSILHELAPQVI